MTNNPEQYFQSSGTVVLPGLEEAVSLPRRVWFRNDGAVSSLVENQVKTVMIIHGYIDLNRSRLRGVLEAPIDRLVAAAVGQMVLAEYPDLRHTNGYCLRHDIPGTGEQAYVVAKRQGLDPTMDVFVDGHESGHFLERNALHSHLQSMLLREGVNLDAGAYSGEDFADIGGLLALRRAVRRGVKGLGMPVFKHRGPIRPEQAAAFAG